MPGGVTPWGAEPVELVLVAELSDAVSASGVGLVVVDDVLEMGPNPGPVRVPIVLNINDSVLAVARLTSQKVASRVMTIYTGQDLANIQQEMIDVSNCPRTRVVSGVRTPSPRSAGARIGLE